MKPETFLWLQSTPVPIKLVTKCIYSSVKEQPAEFLYTI